MSIDAHKGGAKAVKVKIRAKQSPPSEPTSSPLQQALWWFQKASLADGCLAAMTGHRVITQIQRTELADRRQRHAAANSLVLVPVSLSSRVLGFWLWRKPGGRSRLTLDAWDTDDTVLHHGALVDTSYTKLLFLLHAYILLTPSLDSRAGLSDFAVCICLPSCCSVHVLYM